MQKTSRRGSNFVRLRLASLDLSPSSGDTIAGRMALADVTLAVFTLFNTLRFLAYVPQIARALKDRSGAQAISLETWSLFLVSHLSAMAGPAYAMPAD